mgnify:CR=1 FL=1
MCDFEMPPSPSSRYALLVGWSLFLAAACQPGPQDAGSSKASPFYDLEGFFSEEVERLQQEQPPVDKTVTLEGRSEFQQLDSLDYRDELSVFQNSDINRAAWWDRYRIDSTFSGDRLQSITYSARSEELKIRSVRIRFEKENVRLVEIENRTDSPAATMDQQLQYDPQSGYRIETHQNVTFSKPREMIVEVRFRE